jgi:site-specific recombinase
MKALLIHTTVQTKQPHLTAAYWMVLLPMDADRNV